MLETNIPNIDPDELMERARKAAQDRPKPSSSEAAPPPSGLTEDELNTARIEALLIAAEAKSRPRTEMPVALNGFPFKYLRYSRRLKQFALRILELLFYDQRSVNYSLILALRESLAQQRKLNEQVASLKERLKRMDPR